MGTGSLHEEAPRLEGSAEPRHAFGVIRTRGRQDTGKRAAATEAERRLGEELRALADGPRRLARVEKDPVSFVHRFDRADDQEVVGLVAALLAFGNVKAILRSVERVVGVLGPRPAHAVDTVPRAVWERELQGFVHRVYRGDDVAAVLAHAGALRRAHGNLGAFFAACLARSDGGLAEALAEFADALRGEAAGDPASRGLRHLVPDPRAGSACKRLLLYLRWMVRPRDGVDLGLWPVDPAVLLIPVDTHVHRIARNLGLTAQRTASWRTAEEITARLSVFDPADPVRFDFALCHHGISGRCPSRRDAEACEACVLRPVCRHWTRPAKGKQAI